MEKGELKIADCKLQIADEHRLAGATVEWNCRASTLKRHNLQSGICNLQFPGNLQFPICNPIVMICPETRARSEMKELRTIRIFGKVQGVGYRFYATRVARRLNLRGWIRNLRDGTVDAAVEGEASAIDEWVEELREGPRYAEVTKIEQERKDFTGKLGDFDVKF